MIGLLTNYAELIKAIISVFPYYCLLLILRHIIKNSKSADVSPKTITHFNRIDNIMNVIITFITPVLLLTAIAFSCVLFFSNTYSIMNYIVSKTALRFLKYSIEVLLTLVITVIGSMAIFGSTPKNYYGRFSSNDIIKFYKIPQRIFKMIIYYLLGTCFAFLYYLITYLFPADVAILYKPILFSLSFTFNITTLLYVIMILISLLIFILSNNTEKKLMLMLYKNIKNSERYRFRAKTNQIMQGITFLVDTCRNFSLENHTVTFKKSNDKIQNSYIKLYLIIISFLLSMLFSTVLILGFSYKNPIYILSKIFTAFIFNILFHISIIILIFKDKPSPIVQVLVRLILGNSYFTIKKPTPYKNVKLASMCGIFSSKFHFKYYLSGLYNLLDFYKDILETSQKLSDETFNIIAQQGIDKESNYYIYILCSYMYKMKYNSLPPKLITTQNNDTIDKTSHNLSAILKDITETDISPENVQIFAKSLTMKDHHI